MIFQLITENMNPVILNQNLQLHSFRVDLLPSWLNAKVQYVGDAQTVTSFHPLNNAP